MNKEFPVYTVVIDDAEKTGITLVSIVDDPAIEMNFVMLSKEKLKLSLDRDRQIVTGPVLVPDQLIRRRMKPMGDFYLTFSAEKIEKVRNKFILDGDLKHSNLDHSVDDIFDCQLIECWIVDDPEKDKSAALGYTDVVPGTLFMSYYIPDAAIWGEVIKRNGFSIEGNFGFEPVKTGVQGDTVESLLEALLKELEA